MSTTKDALIAHMSAYLDSVIDSKDSDTLDTINQLKMIHQKEITKIIEASSQEIDRLKSKLITYAQTEDNNKFQKRTIASLTAEISSMQSTITSLEKRLKMATDEIRSLKKHTRNIEPVASIAPPAIEPVASIAPPASEQVASIAPPASEQVASIAPPASEPVASIEPPASEPELIPVVLNSGSYYWDPESNDLYEFITEEEAGGVVGLIKSIKIKGKIYYLDTADNSFYEITDTIGQCMGQIIDRKAVFYRS